MTTDMNGNGGRGNAGDFAPSEAGRTVVGSWQEDLEHMEIHPVPLAPSQAQPQMPQQGQWQAPQQMPQPTQQQGQQQWHQATPLNQPQATMRPVNRPPQQMAGGMYPQQGQYPQAGMGQMPMVQQPRKKSKAPLVIFLLVAAAVGAGLFFLTRLPDEPGGDIVDDVPTSTGTYSDDGDGTDGGATARDPLIDDDMLGDGSDGTSSSSGVTEATTPPTSAEFQWAGMAWVKEGHIPERATKLTDLESVLGSWKGYVCYLPVDAGDSKVEQFLNVHVDVNQSSTTFRFDWGYTSIDGGEGQSDSTPDTEFLGTWDRDTGAIYATEVSGNLEMKRFWYEDGYQYAYGTLQLPDGSVGDVYLMRP